MTDELGSDGRALFRAAREALAPTDHDVARMRARIRAAVSGAAAAGVGLAGGKAAAAPGASSAALAAAVVAAIAGTSMVAWWAGTRGSHDASPRAATVAPVAREAPRPADQPHPLPSPAVAPVPPVLIDVTPIEPAAPRAIDPPAPRAHRAPAPKAEPAAAAADLPVASAPDPDPLAAELAHVHDATAALASGDAATALAIARAARAERPEGQLAAEIAAIEIDALCALDRRDEARGAAAELLARWPRSTLRARVLASCAADSPRGATP